MNIFVKRFFFLQNELLHHFLQPSNSDEKQKVMTLGVVTISKKVWTINVLKYAKLHDYQNLYWKCKNLPLNLRYSHENINNSEDNPIMNILSSKRLNLS